MHLCIPFSIAQKYALRVPLTLVVDPVCIEIGTQSALVEIIVVVLLDLVDAQDGARPPSFASRSSYGCPAV